MNEREEEQVGQLLVELYDADAVVPETSQLDHIRSTNPPRVTHGVGLSRLKVSLTPSQRNDSGDVVSMALRTRPQLDESVRVLCQEP